jgi:hypothetical protein
MSENDHLRDLSPLTLARLSVCCHDDARRQESSRLAALTLVLADHPSCHKRGWSAGQLRHCRPSPPGRSVDFSEHRRRVWARIQCRSGEVPSDCRGIGLGGRKPSSVSPRHPAVVAEGLRSMSVGGRSDPADVDRIAEEGEGESRREGSHSALNTGPSELTTVLVAVRRTTVVSSEVPVFSYQ